MKVGDMIGEDDDLRIQLVASIVLDAFDGGDLPLAKQNWVQAPLDNDERARCAQYFGPELRAYLKNDARKYLEEQYERDNVREIMKRFP